MELPEECLPPMRSSCKTRHLNSDGYSRTLWASQMGDHYGYQSINHESSQLSDDDAGRHHGNGHESSVGDQDIFLPVANVSRIMKKSLPASAKISKEAKETVQECVSEFISFVTGEASGKCQREKRKTVNGDDLLWAMSTLGFEDYIEPLKVYLQKYREVEGERASMARQVDQVVTKEGNSSGLSSSTFEMNGSLSGGGMVGTLQLLQQGYDQHRDSLYIPNFSF